MSKEHFQQIRYFYGNTLEDILHLHNFNMSFWRKLIYFSFISLYHWYHVFNIFLIMLHVHAFGYIRAEQIALSAQGMYFMLQVFVNFCNIFFIDSTITQIWKDIFSAYMKRTVSHRLLFSRHNVWSGPCESNVWHISIQEVDKLSWLWYIFFVQITKQRAFSLAFILAYSFHLWFKHSLFPKKMD